MRRSTVYGCNASHGQCSTPSTVETELHTRSARTRFKQEEKRDDRLWRKISNSIGPIQCERTPAMQSKYNTMTDRVQLAGALPPVNTEIHPHVTPSRSIFFPKYIVPNR
ncbi:hypothetical protein HRR83_006590 [Exophiala dermatitidis]|uniref:Uncharacterized protein n=1 Tax=Exophiala dermatitidis TaxID=5970 RepID=A0AAN6ITL5_EXODE|nr:hypothetical protein HRR74_005750 [Exophiala dermatitidis]KAJ4515425.1 hypothetical protein HRR73_005257 [Exophiala dermatitidis]KAJ4533741.1 hypothetical protein HRR77_008225 [Exophiala dermatitidis]KAJ4540952.1 hypothetical protein HRR76_004336 [Exophiala dermatitidis]KAJ4560584.1 hypothetical protein HRR79_007993 [Exophiala dermatitidis]